MVSFLVRRRVSACALPRPSATASARLANSTVNHSQIVVTMVNALGWLIANTVDSSEPTHTTNITGFLIWCVG